MNADQVRAGAIRYEKGTQEWSDHIRLQTEYGLTPRQATYAIETVRDPQANGSEKARRAGYPDGSRTSQGGRLLKSPSIKKGVRVLQEQQAEMERRARAFGKALASDAPAAIQKKLEDHAHDPTVTANQTRAVELIGKMKGVFIDRLEIDPGQNMRLNTASGILSRFTQNNKENEA